MVDFHTAVDVHHVVFKVSELDHSFTIKGRREQAARMLLAERSVGVF